MRKIIFSSLVLLLVGLFLGGSISAKEDINYNNSFASEKEMINYLKEHEVPESKIDLLIEKTRNGEAWDVDIPEKLELVPDSFYAFDIDDDNEEKYYRFDDGSFIYLKLGEGQKYENVPEIPVDDGDITTFGVVRDSFGTLYTNYRVERSAGGATASFVANFYVARYGPSKIYTRSNSDNKYNSPYGGQVRGFGTTGDYYTRMIRDTEYNGQAALFRMYWYTGATVSGSWGGVSGSVPVGGTCNLYLALVNNKMYIASELPF